MFANDVHSSKKQSSERTLIGLLECEQTVHYLSFASTIYLQPQALNQMERQKTIWNKRVFAIVMSSLPYLDEGLEALVFGHQVLVEVHGLVVAAAEPFVHPPHGLPVGP